MIRALTVACAFAVGGGCASAGGMHSIPSNGYLGSEPGPTLELVMRTMESSGWTVTDVNRDGGIVRGSRRDGVWLERCIVRVSPGETGGSAFRITVESEAGGNRATRSAGQLRDLIREAAGSSIRKRI